MANAAKTKKIYSAEEILNEAVDMADLSYSSINTLEGLFNAMERLSDNPSSIKNLASIGRYLADDWAAMVNEYRDKLKEQGEANHG